MVEKVGWRGATRENTLYGSSTEKQRSQTAFCAETLRAAGLSALARVGTVVTARFGDAPPSPPWPNPKSLAAAPRRILRQALDPRRFAKAILVRRNSVIRRRRVLFQARSGMGSAPASGAVFRALAENSFWTEKRPPSMKTEPARGWLRGRTQPHPRAGVLPNFGSRVHRRPSYQTGQASRARNVRPAVSTVLPRKQRCSQAE